MEEYLDILNEKGEKTGKSRSYIEAHEKGLTHKTAHVWIINSKGEILIQKREKRRRAYPGYWDISASGHVSSGQTSLEAAQRETEEELNLKIPASNLKFLCTLEEHIVLNDGTYINNEFQDVYTVNMNLDISEVKFDEEEVEAVKFLPVEEFKKWTEGVGGKMVPRKEEYGRLIEYLSLI